MSNIYENAYQYMLEEGVDEDIAIDAVNILFQENALHNIDEASASRLVTGLSKALGFNRMSTVNALRMMQGMVGSGFSPALQRRMSGEVLRRSSARNLTQKVLDVTKGKDEVLRQGSLLTKTGKAQNFRKGVPFTGTDPVPAASSPLPMAPKVKPEAPGQMRIPGMSDAAQDLRNVTGNRNLGLPGNTQGLAMTGGNNAKRNKSIFKNQELLNSPRLPKPPKSPEPKLDLKKAAVPAALSITGATTGLALANRENQKRKREDEMFRKSVQQQIETEKAGKLGDPGALGNTSDRPTPAPVTPEGVKRKPVNKEKLTAAAKDFDSAFSAARSAGKTEFTWRGKKYNTKYKSEL